MKIHNGLLIAAAVACSISVAPAFAKTAKECTAEFAGCWAATRSISHSLRAQAPSAAGTAAGARSSCTWDR
jgi:hypothetical protein